MRDLEAAVTEEVEAAEQLLRPRPKDVPPQLLMALEKDGRSLARGYEAARALSDGILKGLRSHKDSYKVNLWSSKPSSFVVWTESFPDVCVEQYILLPQEAVTAEQKALGIKVEHLLSMLMEAEAQMNKGMALMDKRERAGIDSSCDQLTQQLSLCKVGTSKPLHFQNQSQMW